jgi:GR25 family glycosyltransferase involved in LPS biosynthesis
MNVTIHVITNGDQERIKKTSDALESYGLTFEFHTFPKHPTNGRHGCYQSHIKMYEYARQHNMDWIAIAEDNIVCAQESIPTTLDRDIKKVLKQNEWEIILFGGWVKPFIRYKKTEYPTLFETHDTHGTSFYFIHKRLYKKMLKHYSFREDHIDNILNQVANTPLVSQFLFYRDYQIQTSNTYFSNSFLQSGLSYFHYYYRRPCIMNLLQQFATNWEIVYLCLIIVFIFIINMLCLK